MSLKTKVNNLQPQSRPSNDYDEQVARALVYASTGCHSVNYHLGRRKLSDFLNNHSNDN